MADAAAQADDAALAIAEERCRAARSIEALAFTIANETWNLLPFRQALVWREGIAGPSLLAVSGLAALPEDSPFTVWVQRLVQELWPRLGLTPQNVDLAAFQGPGANDSASAPMPSRDLVSGWQEWWPAHLMVVPLRRHDEQMGVVLLLFEDALGKDEQALVQRLQGTWSYCAWALTRGRHRLFHWRLPAAPLRWLALIAVAGLLCLPIHQSALAPAEIVALKAIAVAAPIEGVVKTFHVQPNEAARSGQPLFSLDDTTLRNRREVTLRALEVAAAELLSAQQKAFDDNKARGEVATLQGRIAERRAELRAVEEQLRRVDVKAPRDGIAVFGDINDWQGRPVVTGERVMQLADPKDAGVLVFLPVADAIALEHGARVRVFLHVAPLAPVEATLSETSYQAVLSPEGIASYRLRGTIDSADQDVARIGLKGTAKIYGASVPLAYYIMRRPLAALRQWSGL